MPPKKRRSSRLSGLDPDIILEPESSSLSQNKKPRKSKNDILGDDDVLKQHSCQQMTEGKLELREDDWPEYLRGFAVGEVAYTFPRIKDTPPPEIWSCGAIHKSQIDKIPDLFPQGNSQSVQTLHSSTLNLSSQLENLKPSFDQSNEPWQAFFIFPSILKDYCGLEAPELPLHDLVPLFLSTPEPNDQFKIHFKNLLSSRKCFWHQRFYFKSGRVDTKRLAKFKAATNKFKSLIKKGCCIEMKFENPDRCTWDWGILLAGWSKTVAGAIVCVSYTDCDENHFHHGN